MRCAIFAAAASGWWWPPIRSIGAQRYLAAQAGEVYLDPMGLVYVGSFSYYRMFLKEAAIDKLGVDVNVFRAGTFKSFTDQFSRRPASRRASAKRAGMRNGCGALECLHPGRLAARYFAAAR